MKVFVRQVLGFVSCAIGLGVTGCATRQYSDSEIDAVAKPPPASAKKTDPAATPGVPTALWLKINIDNVGSCVASKMRARLDLTREIARVCEEIQVDPSSGRGKKCEPGFCPVKFVRAETVQQTAPVVNVTLNGTSAKNATAVEKVSTAGGTTTTTTSSEINANDVSQNQGQLGFQISIPLGINNTQTQNTECVGATASPLFVLTMNDINTMCQ